jgi:hypothetical protein
MADANPQCLDCKAFGATAGSTTAKPADSARVVPLDSALHAPEHVLRSAAPAVPSRNAMTVAHPLGQLFSRFDHDFC